MRPQYRLVTRSDFDGLVCAVLLKELDMINEILFVHPKDMQDGRIRITHRDILTNLPYVPGCHLAFDHHASEVLRLGDHLAENHIIHPDAPSAARVVYEHFGGEQVFPRVPTEMMHAVDRCDSGNLSQDDILEPKGWVLLNYLMDARTGLGRFKNFRVSNYQLMMELIDYCRQHSIEQILRLPDVRERLEFYIEHKDPAKAQIRRCARLHGEVVVLDMRQELTVYACNRFLVYALFPEAQVSIHVLWGLQQQNTVLAIGKSIINRGAPVDIGSLALKYGGGGHRNAGTCQVSNQDADEVLSAVIQQIQAENQHPAT